MAKGFRRRMARGEYLRIRGDARIYYDGAGRVLVVKRGETVVEYRKRKRKVGERKWKQHGQKSD